MIVPMKKAILVIQEKNQRPSLRALRKAGVVHVHREPGSTAPPETLTAESELLDNAINALPKSSGGSTDHALDREQAGEVATAILGLRRKETEILERLAAYSLDAETLSPWGDFEPADLRILAAKGIDIRLVNADAALREKLADDAHAEFIPLRKTKAIVSGLVVYRMDVPDGGIKGISLPEWGLAELNSLAEAARAELAEIRQELKERALCQNALIAARNAVAQDVEFEEIRDSLEAEEGLAWFTGYLPTEDVEGLKELAAREAWGLMIADPQPDDAVPTLVRNSAAIRIIQPVFNLMGILPGYREVDISFWFLSFLSIFVAMILGDAAYGLIVLLLALVFRIMAKKPSDILRLITLFGLTTLAWGTVTGTWFSSLPLVRDTFLRKLVIPGVATYQAELFPGYTASLNLFPGDSLNAEDMVKWISLFFGIVMISIARIQNFIRKLPSIAALAQVGWLSIVLALYWLIMELVLQLTPLPFFSDAVFPMLIGGMILILVFGGQEKGRSFGKGLLQGLKDLLPTSLNAIGAFGDIISFIRLFAVGLAGVALAQSFNGMAPKGGVFALIAAALILALGHTLNLVLNALSVLVHGVRLNVLEFSGHLDIGWAGTGFEPFRLRVLESESPETYKE